MDPFINLPPEKIEEICIKLDNKSLSNLMKTSATLNQACKRVFGKRELEYIRKLIESLVGKWSSPLKYLRRMPFGIVVEIEDINPDYLQFLQPSHPLFPEALLDDMSIIDSSKVKLIPKVPSSLLQLYNKLIKLGYEKWD